MTAILNGLRIVEGSAFIAAPMGGMTLAQLGADVIRFDDLRGGLDTTAGRSPRTAPSLFGRASTRASARSPSTSAPRGRELSRR